MSPKMCSLAYDDTEVGNEGATLAGDSAYEPNLTVIINKKTGPGSSHCDEVIQVRGRINVSF